MATKEELVNSLVIKLADVTNISVRDLKEVISAELYEYSVEKVSSTELSTCDGSITKALMEYFEVGKLSANMSPNSINRYRETVFQLCRFCKKELSMITSEDVNVFYTVIRKFMDCRILQ